MFRRFTIQVGDMFGGVYGQVRTPSERRFNFVLDGMSTAAFRVPTSDPMAPYLVDDALIKVYYGADLVFHGPVTSWERVHQGNTHSIAVNAGDPFFYLNKRYVNKTTGDRTITGDRGMLVGSLIQELNDESRTGIQVGGQVSYSESDVVYVINPFKPMREIIQELQVGEGGFDWRVMPSEFTADGSFGQWYAEPVVGRHLEDSVIFESGGLLSNVSEAHETGDRQTAANRIYVISSGGAGAPGIPPVVASDAASEEARLLQEDVIAADLGDPTLNQELANAHLAIRNGARRVVSVTPTRYDASHPNRVPTFGPTGDFDVGDWVLGRAQDETGIWMNDSMRVWAVTLAPDSNGVDSLSLTLAQEG